MTLIMFMKVALSSDGDTYIVFPYWILMNEIKTQVLLVAHCITLN